MDILVDYRDDIVVMTCSGRMTLDDGRADLRELFIEAMASGRQDFVIDLAAVPYVDTSVLGEVMACWKRAAECGGLVKLVLEREGRVVRLLELTGLDKVFEPYDDVDQAIADF